MDANSTEKPDYYLLIDLYLEGWLDDAAMAEVDYRLETDEEFRKQVATLLALREEAEEIQYEQRSQEAVQAMLQTIAVERQPTPSRLRQIIRDFPYKLLARLTIIGLIIGLVFALYRLYWIPTPRHLSRNRPPVLNPDSSEQAHQTNDQLVKGADTIRKAQHHQRKGAPVLMATKHIKVSLSDDLFGQSPDGIPNDTLTTQLYRVTGQMEYEIRKDTLNLYLPGHMAKNPKLSISQQSDSTFKLTIDKKSFMLKHKGRHSLK